MKFKKLRTVSKGKGFDKFKQRQLPKNQEQKVKGGNGVIIEDLEGM